MDKMLDGNTAAESAHATAVDGAEATYARYEDRARNRVIEKLLGHDSRKSVQKHECGVFYLVEYTQMGATYTFSATGNTNANTGKYTAVNNPFNGGITFRLDF